MWPFVQYAINYYYVTVVAVVQRFATSEPFVADTEPNNGT